MEGFKKGKEKKGGKCVGRGRIPGDRIKRNSASLFSWEMPVRERQPRYSSSPLAVWSE